MNFNALIDKVTKAAAQVPGGKQLNRIAQFTAVAGDPTAGMIALNRQDAQTVSNVSGGIGTAASTVAYSQGWNPIGWVAGIIAVVATGVSIYSGRKAKKEVMQKAQKRAADANAKALMDWKAQQSQRASIKFMQDREAAQSSFMQKISREGAARDKASRDGFKSRSLADLERDFGNHFAERNVLAEKKTRDSVTLLDADDFNQVPEYLTGKAFGVAMQENQL